MFRLIRLWWWRLEAWHLRGELEDLDEYLSHPNCTKREQAELERKQARRELAEANKHVMELSR